MSIIFAGALAGLGVSIGIVHSWFAKPFKIGELYPESDEKRRIIGLIWHLPSMTWAGLAIAVFAARLLGVSNLPLTSVAIFLLGVSGLGNLWACRKPDIGGVLLLIATALAAADWFVNL
jgi:hypothetical protein